MFVMKFLFSKFAKQKTHYSTHSSPPTHTHKHTHTHTHTHICVRTWQCVLRCLMV